MKKFWRISVLTLVSMLGACTSLERINDDQVSQSSAIELQRTGRFAVLVYDKTQDKNIDSVQGNFEWLSAGERVVLDLSSPLGQVLARVNVQPGLSQLIRSNGEVLEASSPDALVREVIGRQFPVSGLQYWIRGQAMPGVALETPEYDAQQRLVKFVQAGWVVTAQDYDGMGPKRFHLLNNQTMERITIRIVMN
ncbi:outer membrane lipoprotein LolB [Pelistega suis]|uniref:Outer-membrane lipoprotein LolB n=1 Tax=Pelistega suis TaxID=1631957 RepID=A0A849P377_9BURK|nr:outer membrane lipoprotein LolB [Pelistega suis]NOL51950.1 outer membrane lipoprotein LolB [Pelistega suis]